MEKEHSDIVSTVTMVEVLSEGIMPRADRAPNPSSTCSCVARFWYMSASLGLYETLRGVVVAVTSCSYSSADVMNDCILSCS